MSDRNRLGEIRAKLSARTGALEILRVGPTVGHERFDEWQDKPHRLLYDAIDIGRATISDLSYLLSELATLRKDAAIGAKGRMGDDPHEALVRRGARRTGEAPREDRRGRLEIDDFEPSARGGFMEISVNQLRHAMRHALQKAGVFDSLDAETDDIANGLEEAIHEIEYSATYVLDAPCKCPMGKECHIVGELTGNPDTGHCQMCGWYMPGRMVCPSCHEEYDAHEEPEADGSEEG